MVLPVRKAVFPVAGFGTRLLPATKVMPKEMLPIVDRPLIEYAVQEALEAGIDDFIFVTGRGKTLIEEHFDHSYELEAQLLKKGKKTELTAVQKMTLDPGHLFYTRQRVPLGLGHAVWCARRLIGDEPFAVLLPDDLILATPGCLKQMVDIYHKIGGNLVAVEDVPREETNRYGILEIAHDDGHIAKAHGLIEKPEPNDAPSTLSVIGRYILQPDIFKYLNKHKKGAGGEIQLTDAISKTMSRVDLHGLRFKGRRFDCGTKIGFVAANMAFAVGHEDMRKDIREIIGSML